MLRNIGRSVTRKTGRRNISPIRPVSMDEALDVSGSFLTHIQPNAPTIDPIHSSHLQRISATEDALTAIFKSESVVAEKRPWIRLDRGMRLKKFRMFSQEYPGLNEDERETLFRTLVTTNDLKGLNSKQQITYDSKNSKILDIKGLVMNRADAGTGAGPGAGTGTGAGTIQTTFKIEHNGKGTKKAVKTEA